MGKIVPAALKNQFSLLVTADHGNGEYLINESDNTPNTAHTTNDVPLILIQPQAQYNIKSGKLADLAPTILALMELNRPKEMDGDNLLCALD